MDNVTPSNATKVVEEVKAGFRTTEFYLATFVAVVGAVVQFLPPAQADPLVKAAAIISAVLAALGYTVSRTVVKTNQGQ